ncbi:MAG: hypothetical protein LBR11_06105 [Deltaproteobacteria bacterium]|nr:hypothetical protein [Deltaproteobacteria bacterium]
MGQIGHVVSVGVETPKKLFEFLNQPRDQGSLGISGRQTRRGRLLHQDLTIEPRILTKIDDGQRAHERNFSQLVTA